MATTEWVQKAGMSSATEVDNIETLLEQAEASETAAAASAASASTSATSASTSETNAASSASSAATSASNSATSETNAATSESNAATSASNAATSETNAANSASAASTSETNAATSASNAATSETNAAASESNAATSAANAETAYDNFDDRYLGDKASDPSLDNDGDALVAGALYYNTTSGNMKVYSGSAWQDVAPVATSLTVSQISDLTATAAELNLMDGVTATTAEINYLSGVTSAIQTQIDAKAATLADLGVTATAAELNALDGITATVTELNYIDGVTSAVQTQLDAKAPTASPTFTGTVSFSGGIDETVYALSGTTPALDPANGTIQTWTLSGNSTPTDSLAEGESITLMIDDGTDYTITWPTMTWVNGGGTAPTLATTGYTVVAIWKVSTTLYGALVGDGS